MDNNKTFPAFYEQLIPIFAHRSDFSNGNSYDRYLFSNEQTLKGQDDYNGTGFVAFYALHPESTIGGTLPIYRFKKIKGNSTYYKLSAEENTKDGWVQDGKVPLFLAFINDAGNLQTLDKLYEHQPKSAEEHENRFYYDLLEKSIYNWTDGSFFSYVVSKEKFYEFTIQKFFVGPDSLAEMLRKKTGVPGMSIALVYGNETSLFAYGECEYKSKNMVNADTIFQLASVSKPITSTIVAALVGQSVFKWSDPIAALDGTLLKDSKLSKIEIQQFLAHCSGLPDHAGDILEDTGYTREEIFDCLKQLPLLAPSSKFQYTNFGITMGGVAAASAAYKKGMASKNTWEDLAKEQLYDKVGMKRTSSSSQTFKADSNRAVGHVRSVFSDGDRPNQWIVSPEQRRPDVQSPAGGVHSCATDLAKWMQLQLRQGVYNGQQIVAPEALARTHRPFPEGGPHGLGWDVKENGNLSHSGAFLIGASTCVYIIPSFDLGITILTNGQPVGLPEAICCSFRDYLLTPVTPSGVVDVNKLSLEWLDIIGKGMSALYADDSAYEKEAGKKTPSRNVKDYCGVYMHLYFGCIIIFQDEHGFQITFNRIKDEKPPIPLQFLDGDTFVFKTFGENAVGLTPVIFDLSGPEKGSLRIPYMPFSDTNAEYSESAVPVKNEGGAMFVRL